jgi:hypothetical protein
MKRLTFRILIAVLTLLVGIGISKLFSSLSKTAANRTSISISLTPPASQAALPHLDRFIPPNWHRADGGGFFSFYLPKNVKLISDERSEEAGWGSTFANDRIRIYAEYTSLAEGWAAHYLGKQNYYEMRVVEISGRKALMHSWCWAQPQSNFSCQAELQIRAWQQQFVLITIETRELSDLVVANQIFRTVELP